LVPGKNKRRGRDRGRPRGPRQDEPELSSEPMEVLPLPGDPRLLGRSEHCISRKNIDQDCLKVMQRLIRHGYMAFLVGGGVRDLLLKRIPKDFDVGTDASPEQVRQLFRNSRIIGRRFRLNHVFFHGGKTIEVATFRGETTAEDGEVQTLAKDNTFGDAQTDAMRRDLTINGLFYDLRTFSVVDYVGGIADLEAKSVRVIGDPEVRFVEDPVRMIRAVRHAARTEFTIEENTFSTMCRLADKILLVPKARLYEEFQRELVGGVRNEFVSAS
jgi:poly(A) polymerase